MVATVGPPNRSGDPAAHLTRLMETFPMPTTRAPEVPPRKASWLIAKAGRGGKSGCGLAR